MEDNKNLNYGNGYVRRKEYDNTIDIINIRLKRFQENFQSLKMEMDREFERLNTIVSNWK